MRAAIRFLQIVHWRDSLPPSTNFLTFGSEMLTFQAIPLSFQPA